MLTQQALYHLSHLSALIPHPQMQQPGLSGHPGARHTWFSTSMALQTQHKPWGLLGETVMPTTQANAPCPSAPSRTTTGDR